MLEIKIKMCREHWDSLSKSLKEDKTAKHLITAIEVAEQLLRQNNKLEMENREYRIGEYEE